MASLPVLFFVQLLCCLVGLAKGYINLSERSIFHEGFPRQTSGRKRSIRWPSAKPVPVQKEIELLRSGTLVRKGEFGPLHGSRALEVELECAELGISFHQALSIRKQLMIGKTLHGSWKFKNERILKSMIKKFEHQQKPLLEIAKHYDLPPVSIFRAIVAPRVQNANTQLSRRNRRIVQSIISESCQENLKSFLSEWEIKELQTAKANDVVGHKSNCTVARDWEKQIYTFLNDQGISFVAEDSLRQQGYEMKTTSTPDCLLLDNLSINGHEIRWIEFKSFYASGLRKNSYFTKKAVSKQIEKYRAEFGENGAMILKNGFSNKISQRYPSILFLDDGPLNSDNGFTTCK